MTPQEYIDQGTMFQGMGYATDGCSFIGWFMPKKYTPACWAHDYGRNGVIEFTDQSDNDNMFRNALRHLGMSKTASNIIYYFTRFQGWFVEKTGIPATTMIAFFVFAVIIGFGIWFNNKP